MFPTWRALGVAGAALTAYVHVAEFGSTWAESHVIAVGFLALAAGRRGQLGHVAGSAAIASEALVVVSAAAGLGSSR